MKRVIFDIETVGCDFESLDSMSQEYFLRFAESEVDLDSIRDSLSFYPLTGEIIAIAMLDADSDKGAVFYQRGDNTEPRSFQDENIFYISGTEGEILTQFWHHMMRFDQFISFNGRLFDGPFLMIRSAVNRIKVLKNLCPYRFSHNVHIDLADQLSFYDCLRRKFSLHMWCKTFGIESPKNEGINGLEVKRMYREVRYEDIARYCMKDCLATKELFKIWDSCLKV